MEVVDNASGLSEVTIVDVMTDAIYQDAKGNPMGLLSELLPLAAEAHSPLKSQYHLCY